jgi:trk system potassium uptake protein TrkH
MNLLFEAVSGSTSTGLGTGVTSDLTLPGQIVMMLAMLVGRLGPLALLMAVTPTGAGSEPHERQGEGVSIA